MGQLSVQGSPLMQAEAFLTLGQAVSSEGYLGRDNQENIHCVKMRAGIPVEE